jgi:thioesterase domain-containing protein
LFGYSFGGLVALAVAEQLAAAGERVERLWLADPFYDRRYWPAATFAGAQVDRARHHLRGIAELRPSDAARELARCARSLAARLSARARPAGASPASGGDDHEARASAAMSAWRPRRWPGPTTLIAASPGLEFGCDVARLWRSLLPRLSIERVAADGHRDLMRSPAALDAIATLVSREQAAPPPPRVVVVTRYRWMTTARIALDFADAGFEVVALSPRGHVVAAMPFVAASARLPWRARAVATRLAALAPDIVVPSDDAAAMLLHAVAALTSTDPTIRDVLARSLGRGDLERLYSRSGVLAAAAAAGIACAPQTAVERPCEAAAFAAARGGRTVVKADGSWGGRGVIIADDPAAAAAASARLGRPAGTARTLKRLLVDRDLPMLCDWLRRRRPPVSIQGFVAGRDANIAVACWDGELLASVAVEVSKASHATGPATVVKVIDHAGMTQAARRLCAELGLSGLFGLDFILDDEGRAWLIELNPRATPTCHLAPAAGPRLAAALRQRLGGEAATTPRRRSTDALIVMFPQGLVRHQGERGYAELRDVPWHAPDLVEQGLALAAARRPRGGRSRAG